MTPPLTPGAYLKHRRQAAMLSVADVAARISTVPRTPEHERGEWLELIEADIMPMTLTTIVALRLAYRFDIHVLALLEAIRQGHEAQPPQLCRICACSDHDACWDAQGDGCAWVADDLCSACAGAPAAQAVAA